MKIAIVGIGGSGSAAARFLAQAGHEVVGYEQFQIGHTLGSSHGESRIIRYTYPDLLYTQMMGDAYPLWAALEQAAGEELFVRCGGLYLGPDGHPDLIEIERALIAARLSYEKLDPSAVQARYPAFRLQPGEIAIFQSESGFLRATRCVMANVRLARQYGATILEETPVATIRSQGERAIVRTQAGQDETFDRVIVTSGAWIGKLLADLNLPLKVTRQQILYLRIERNPDHFEPARHPIWIDAGANNYGFPSDGRIEGVKLASHDQGEVVNPDQPRRPVDQDYIQKMRAYAAMRFPDLSEEVMHAQTCLYTNTPDEDFILGRLPDAPNVWMVSGCSGHGFKFTVLLGKIIADLATGRSYSRDLSRFSVKRET